MKRASLPALLLLASACGSATPVPADEERSRCGGVHPDPWVPGIEHGPSPRIIVDDTRPPRLLDASLTLGGQPVKHMLPAEQGAGTPVPIYVEPPAGAAIEEVRLRYKAFGAATYRSLPMKKLGSGFAVEIPCQDVTSGPLKYFISFLDEQHQELGSLGSRQVPLHVEIKYELKGGSPSLPGRKPPRQCEYP